MTLRDASGAIELLLHTDRGARLAAVLEDETEIIHAPHLMDLDIAPVIRGTLDEEAAANALRRCPDFDVERHPQEPLLERIRQLRANVSACDAIYVALARLQDYTTSLRRARRLAARCLLGPGLRPIAAALPGRILWELVEGEGR